MSDAEWEEAYRAAWEAVYNPEHIRTVLRRSAACQKGRPKTTLSTLLWFKLVDAYEKVHPLEGGAFRLKFRRDRRSDLPRENPLVFYPRYAADIFWKLRGYVAAYRQCKAILDEVMAAPDRWTYSDVAIAPPAADEFETLGLYRDTAGGEAALARKFRGDAIREGAHAAAWQAPAGG